MSLGLAHTVIVYGVIKVVRCGLHFSGLISNIKHIDLFEFIMGFFLFAVFCNKIWKHKWVTARTSFFELFFLLCTEQRHISDACLNISLPTSLSVRFCTNWNFCKCGSHYLNFSGATLCSIYIGIWILKLGMTHSSTQVVKPRWTSPTDSNTSHFANTCIALFCTDISKYHVHRSANIYIYIYY